jgi:hypothetical protein
MQKMREIPGVLSPMQSPVGEYLTGLSGAAHYRQLAETLETLFSPSGRFFWGFSDPAAVVGAPGAA